MERYLLIEQCKSRLIANLMRDGVDSETAREVARTWIELCEAVPDVCWEVVADLRKRRPN